MAEGTVNVAASSARFSCCYPWEGHLFFGAVGSVCAASCCPQSGSDLVSGGAESQLFTYSSLGSKRRRKSFLETHPPHAYSLGNVGAGSRVRGRGARRWGHCIVQKCPLQSGTTWGLSASCRLAELGFMWG